MKETVFLSGASELQDIFEVIYKNLPNIGFKPIWYKKSFPGDMIDAVSRCLQLVEEADRFILVIDKKYGQHNNNVLSVTEQEFLTALEKKKPILVFVRSSIFFQLEMYNHVFNKAKNRLIMKHFKDLGYTAEKQVYEFILRIKNNGMIVPWISHFEFAEDILHEIIDKWGDPSSPYSQKYAKDNYTPKFYVKYGESFIKRDYLEKQLYNEISFVDFAAEIILERILNNQAGNLELDEAVVDKIYLLAQELSGEIYTFGNSSLEIPEGMVYVPPGEFIMGGSRLGNELIRIENIEYGYFIDKYPVTNYQYRLFIEVMNESRDHEYCHKSEPKDKDHTPYSDFSGKTAKDLTVKGFSNDYFWNKKYDSYPVVNIDWWDAFAYSNWAKKRLPLEKEWEKAARGIDGRLYPWGDRFIIDNCNVAESQIYHTTPVDKYSSGKSPYGCYDMCGNVWEWIQDTFELTPSEKNAVRVVKGGSCTRGKIKAISSFRNGRHPFERWISRGFRCVKDINKI